MGEAGTCYIMYFLTPRVDTHTLHRRAPACIAQSSWSWQVYTDYLIQHENSFYNSCRMLEKGYRKNFLLDILNLDVECTVALTLSYSYAATELTMVYSDSAKSGRAQNSCPCLMTNWKIVGSIDRTESIEGRSWVVRWRSTNTAIHIVVPHLLRQGLHSDVINLCLLL